MLLSVRRADLYTCIYTQRSEPSLCVVAKWPDGNRESYDK